MKESGIDAGSKVRVESNADLEEICAAITDAGYAVKQVKHKEEGMALEFDHIFICCSPGAPEGDALVRLGFIEGSPNTHPGQGTANRRFFFDNAFVELLWVSDPAEVRSEQTRRTKLWERWSQRASGACPFGIVFRPKDGHAAPAPFATWKYCPNYLPSGLAIEFAEDIPLDEPELVYLPFIQRSGPPAHEPTKHALPIRQVCGIEIGLPSVACLSQSSQTVRSAGLIAYRFAAEHVLELTFFAAQEITLDLRPTLPLLLRGVVQVAASPD
jgi:glyoxalase-like protein